VVEHWKDNFNSMKWKKWTFMLVAPALALPTVMVVAAVTPVALIPVALFAAVIGLAIRGGVVGERLGILARTGKGAQGDSPASA
jgi:hypothetical protein